MKDLTKCVLITATLFVLYSCMDKNGLNGAPEPTPEPEKRLSCNSWGINIC